MEPALLLVHGVLAVVALFSAGSEPEGRARFLRGLAIAGAVCGLALFFAGPLLEGWRTTSFSPSTVRIAGVAIAAGWIMVAVEEDTRNAGRWDVAALTGVAASALALFATNEWIVPALLFAGIASLGIVLLLDRGSLARLVAVLGIASLVAVLIWRVFDTTQWSLPMPAPTPILWVTVASAVAFAAVPILTEPKRSIVLPASPLALGLAFAIFASVARGGGPVVGLLLVAVAVAASVRVLTTKTASHRLVLLWVVSLTIGLAALSASPYVITRAAVAGLLAAGALTLWPLALGRAQIERGLLVAFVAATAGFNAIAAAATYAFERGSSFERVLEAAPWAGVAAVLPVALAGGVVLGASVGRNDEPEEFVPAAVVATWAFVVLTVMVGVFPYLGAATGTARGVTLYVVAVLAGIGAARYARGIGGVTDSVKAPSRFVIGGRLARGPEVLSIVSVGVGAVAALAILALTLQGLRLGFL